MGETRLQQFINFSLRYMSDLVLPAKRGTFVEFRKGMLNLSPVGRSCSQVERDAFVAFNKEHRVIEKFAERLRSEFRPPEFDLEISIGRPLLMRAMRISRRADQRGRVPTRLGQDLLPTVSR